MRILLTNDDGIHAEGLNNLRKNLEKSGNILVVAPDRERSGAGHSTSIHKTISCRKTCFGQQSYGYAISGTPADCIILGVEKLFRDDKPDIIISGINAGLNIGRDIFYSGTIGAAVEGAFHNIFSLAVSLEKNDNPFFYSSAIKIIEKIINTLPQEINKQAHVLNINIPNIEYSKIKGVKLTNLAQVFHKKTIKNIYQQNNMKYFWIEGTKPDAAVKEKTDYWAVCNKYISITDISIEFKRKNAKNNHSLEKWVSSLNDSLLN